MVLFEREMQPSKSKEQLNLYLYLALIAVFDTLATSLLRHLYISQLKGNAYLGTQEINKNMNKIPPAQNRSNMKRSGRTVHLSKLHFV